MSMETDVLLRAILFQIMTSDSVEEIETAVKAMCSKDQITSVKDSAEEYRRIKKNK